MRQVLEEFSKGREEAEEVVMEEANSLPLHTKLGRKHVRLIIHAKSSLRNPAVRAARLQRTKTDVPCPVVSTGCHSVQLHHCLDG